MRLAFALALLPLCASAEGFVTAISDSSVATDSQAAKIHRVTQSVVRPLVATKVEQGPAIRRGAPRACTDDCDAKLVRSLESNQVVLLSVKVDSKSERVSGELSVWVDGERVGPAKKLESPSIDALDGVLPPVLETVLPVWMRRGWGGLQLRVEPGTLVKIDGRVSNSKPGELVALPAGPHQIDVVFRDGHAVLQRLEVPEGSRLRLEVAPAQGLFDSVPVKRSDTLRTVSYALWVVGAAAIAGGLIAGASSRGTSAGLTPCVGASRDCATLDVVLARQQQAARDATTANIFLVAGGGLAALGAGLFIVDAVTP